MTIGQQPEPDIDIETGLVTGVTAWRRTTSGLAQITNGEDAQALLCSGRRQVLEILNERGMAKKAAPVAPHRLKARPLRRQSDRTLHTASRIGPHSAWQAWGRSHNVTPALGQTPRREHAPDHQHDEPESLHEALSTQSD